MLGECEKRAHLLHEVAEILRHVGLSAMHGLHALFKVLALRAEGLVVLRHARHGYVKFGDSVVECRLLCLEGAGAVSLVICEPSKHGRVDLVGDDGLVGIPVAFGADVFH